ncbi:hypothetical protein B7P43_G05847 [Cryptotermes secundus]|uniref:E3 ubiquitin-protein ligase n=1 Tax=Cryptotermes secundus TaxID=105785 RepID=A0A2J7QN66_9NEOP|nr:hypothetical protein B7P43_G05847 [Cryptotermes secundus]
MEAPGTDFDEYEFECTFCKDNIRPPATVCETGHAICSRCGRFLEDHPTCAGSPHEARCFATDNFARLGIHEPYPTVECNCPVSLTSRSQCPWAGKLEEIKKHIIQNHDKRIADKSGKFSMPFTNVTSQASYSLVISTLGEVFLRRAQIRDDNFYLVVMYIGPIKYASRFKYSFTINKKNSVENISICQKTRSFTENCEDIYRSRNCIKLHYDVVSDFLLDNNDLPNMMEISRV